MLRRSDFIDARYAFSFVFANFGIAIAARIPMITTTIRSSIRVNPFLFRDIKSFLPLGERLHSKDEWALRAATRMRRSRRNFPSGIIREIPRRAASASVAGPAARER